MKNNTNRQVMKGDTIRLLPEWMDSGDELIHFVASEDYNGSGKIYIHDFNSAMYIVPHSLVTIEMIESISINKRL